MKLIRATVELNLYDTSDAQMLAELQATQMCRYDGFIYEATFVRNTGNLTAMADLKLSEP
jgi:hypothetical protein